jgi:hypothetical protein
MTNERYLDAVVKAHPEYAGRWLLIADPGGAGLLRLANGSLAALRIDSRSGALNCTWASSLRDVGRRFLGLRAPSVPQVLRRLVTPEMELERIFNVLRYEYVRGILTLERSPERVAALLHASHNSFCKALLGMPVRGKKGTARRLLRKYGASTRGAPAVGEATEALRAVLAFLFRLPTSTAQLRRLYAELIAIKPGLHEIWRDSLDLGRPHWAGLRDRLAAHPKDTDRRIRVLARFHGLASQPIAWSDERLANQINSYAYRSFAPCNITEGPCFMRKRPDIALADVLDGAGALPAKAARARILGAVVVFDYQSELNSTGISKRAVLARMADYATHAVRWGRA